jgi:hypothetical protein
MSLDASTTDVPITVQVTAVAENGQVLPRGEVPLIVLFADPRGINTSVVATDLGNGSYIASTFATSDGQWTVFAWFVFTSGKAAVLTPQQTIVEAPGTLGASGWNQTVPAHSHF